MFTTVAPPTAVHLSLGLAPIMYLIHQVRNNSIPHILSLVMRA